MKSKKLVIGVVIVVLTAIAFSSCGGGNDPRSLARETIELTAEMMANPSKRPDIEKRMAQIEERVEKMSSANQLIYAAEIMRLSAERAGDLFRSAYEGSETQEAMRALGESLNTPEAQESMRAINDAFTTNVPASQSSEFQEAADSFNEALQEIDSVELQNALRALQGLFGQ